MKGMKTKLNRFGCLTLALTALALSLHGAVVVTPTINPADLAAALNAQGLTITSAGIEYGIDGQFGTYSNFTLPPVTIGNGVVLSSGDVSHVGDAPDPSPEFPEPSYWMGDNSSPEFEAYGAIHIENFTGAYDVASLRVDFNLTTNSQVKFDFIFGSVEYPYWTSDFTDALLVFLDGTDPTNQITFDANGQPVQVGLSFSGQVVTTDQNTAFANPHGLLMKLTTTTSLLPAGNHTLRFEVGDVRDASLDSAVFITNLRAESGTEGTDLSNPPVLTVTSLQSQPGGVSIGLAWIGTGTNMTLESSASVTGPWVTVPATLNTNQNIISTTVTNAADRQFFRLRKQ